MRLLYISGRLNVQDGSAIHGRSFAQAVQNLGHPLMCYPELQGDSEALVGNGSPDSTVLRQRPRGHPVRVIKTLRKGMPLLKDSTLLLQKVSASMSRLRDMSPAVGSFQPDVAVYRHSLFDVSPQMLKHRFDIPLIAEVNSIRTLEGGARMSERSPTTIAKSVERWALSKADACFGVSEGVCEQLQALFPEKPCIMIPNGVDLKIFDSGRYSRQSVKAELGVEGKIVLGYLGSYKPWHGLETTVAVLQALVRDDDRYHLLLIGNGECRREIGNLIGTKRLESHVTQLDSVAHSDVPRMLRAFDFAVMTYPLLDRFYFSPLKMFEYMAMEIPIISTGIGQIATIIEHNKTGFLVANPTPDEFVKTMVDATRKQSRLREIGRAAREKVHAEYSWGINAERVIGLCEEVLNKRSHRA